jgi:hypothetical protein
LINIFRGRFSLPLHADGKPSVAARAARPVSVKLLENLANGKTPFSDWDVHHIQPEFFALCGIIVRQPAATQAQACF